MEAAPNLRMSWWVILDTIILEIQRRLQVQVEVSAIVGTKTS